MTDTSFLDSLRGKSIKKWNAYETADKPGPDAFVINTDHEDCDSDSDDDDGGAQSSMAYMALWIYSSELADWPSYPGTELQAYANRVLAGSWSSEWYVVQSVNWEDCEPTHSAEHDGATLYRFQFPVFKK
jgi:hypothetical protein